MQQVVSSSDLLPVVPLPSRGAAVAAAAPLSPTGSSPPRAQEKGEHHRSGGISAPPSPTPPAHVSSDSADEEIVVCQRRSYGGTGTQHTSSDLDGEGACVVVPQGKSPEMSDSCCGVVRRFVLTRDPLLYGILKWGLAGLLLLFLSVMVFGLLYSGLRYGKSCTNSSDQSELTKPPHGPCVTPFGTILGVHDGVFGYSNCNDNYVSIEDANINVTVPVTDAETGRLTSVSKSLYTGLAWQCVEYARRYWMQRGKPQLAYFGSVDGASDIWNLTFVRLVANTSNTLPLRRFNNGGRVMDGVKIPEVGDIIIYPIQPGGFPFGHVAVITKVEVALHGAVYVAEQNWANAKWTGPYHNYTRRLPLHYDSQTTTISIDDPDGYIIGWMRYG
ncbi:cysteine peptidase, Clan CA, family C51 [Novymonas esmeraldas]|uniref:Cysteine peptidase, Clan CA, family C51 n=1 Tax=Novymonas esmeraldas TaxID=1808958 RepID=A0AAW0F7M2_9TRYP